jgi:molybdopterin synthase sulfur carrier subunit
MIKVLFFGQLKELLGVAGTEIATECDITVSQLLEKMVQANPQWAQDLGSETLLVAVDQIMAKADTMVFGSSEVAFFPPVTGG